jgi:hypothetical protein
LFYCVVRSLPRSEAVAVSHEKPASRQQSHRYIAGLDKMYRKNKIAVIYAAPIHLAKKYEQNAVVLPLR